MRLLRGLVLLLTVARWGLAVRLCTNDVVVRTPGTASGAVDPLLLYALARAVKCDYNTYLYSGRTVLVITGPRYRLTVTRLVLAFCASVAPSACGALPVTIARPARLDVDRDGFRAGPDRNRLFRTLDQILLAEEPAASGASVASAGRVTLRWSRPRTLGEFNSPQLVTIGALDLAGTGARDHQDGVWHSSGGPVGRVVTSWYTPARVPVVDYRLPCGEVLPATAVEYSTHVRYLDNRPALPSCWQPLGPTTLYSTRFLAQALFAAGIETGPCATGLLVARRVSSTTGLANRHHVCGLEPGTPGFGSESGSESGARPVIRLLELNRATACVAIELLLKCNAYFQAHIDPFVRRLLAHLETQGPGADVAEDD